MTGLSFSECFSKYGAKLVNPNWAVSAQAADGSIVISCWAGYFSKPDPKTMRYTDTLSRWSGNKAGNNLLREHLSLAREQKLPIRLVLAKATDMTVIDEGKDASSVSKTFHVRTDLVGSLTSYDDDQFIIDFTRT